MSKPTQEEKQKRVDESVAKLKKENENAKYLFSGIHKPGRPDSQVLSDYYDDLHGQIKEVKDIRYGPRVTKKLLTIEQIEKYCDMHNVLFHDPAFPPFDDSLYKMTDKSQEKPVSKRPLIIWKRPTEFFNQQKDGPIKLFHAIEANDINQGMLGDCWLMCSLSAAAEYPQIIEGIFVGDNDSYSPQGVYQIRLFKEGMEEIILLDDFFPCWSLGGPIYSKASGNELWVMLLEKAFAKYNGSYASLSAGKPFEALIDLTGCPWYEYRFADAGVKKTIEDESLFDKIASFDQAGYIMSITTGGKDEKSEGDRSAGGPGDGILAGHAYTLYSAAKLSNGKKLFNIRNPWGNFEWTGDWGDDSPLWTPALKKEMENKGFSMEKRDDGMFWMAFDDVVKHFVGINVVLVPKKLTWHTSRETFSLQLADNDAYGLRTDIFKLTVQQAGHFFFSVHQKDKRVVGSVGYFDFGVTILRQIDHSAAGDGNSDFEFIESSGIASERQLQTEVANLEAGEYWIVPTSTGTKMKQFVKEGNKDFARRTAGLVIHSQKPHKLEVLHEQEDKDTPQVRLAREHAMEDPVMLRKDRDEKDPYKNGSLLVSSIRNGYAGRSYCVMNQTDDRKKYPKSIYYSVSIDLSESTNVVSHRGSLKTEVVVAPGESEIVHHCFPDKEGVGGFTVSARRNQKKLTQQEIIDYLNANYEHYKRLKEKNLIDFAYTHPEDK